MRKALFVAAMLIGLPVVVHAQSVQPRGFYIGVEGGANWLLNQTINTPALGASINVQPDPGFAAGGVVGYDFLGPRVEVEAVHRRNTAPITLAIPGDPVFAFTAESHQTAILANVLYDIFAGSPVVPYIGAGAGVAFTSTSAVLGGGQAIAFQSSSTQFAYQGIVGLGLNVSPQIRVNLDGRYYGTTSPTIDATGGSAWQNNNISVMLGLQFRFGAP